MSLGTKGRRTELYSKAKVGTVAGLVGGFALFASFFGIDSHMSLEPGTFYKMVGLSVGLEGLAAVAFGFMAHMLTAALIGAVFCTASLLHRVLHISSIPKGVFAGAATGLGVFVIFFMPITLFVMMPTLGEIASGEAVAVPLQDQNTAQALMEKTDLIMWGSLVLHIIYGSIMGLFCGMVLYEEYHHPKKRTTDLESESMPAT